MIEEILQQMQINLHRKVPLSEQIQEEIRRLIAVGSLLPGDPLPTVRQLAAQLRVNFNTVARAYRVMDEEGLIVTRQGRGTFVSIFPTEGPHPYEQEVHIDVEIQQLITRMQHAGMRREEAFQALSHAVFKELNGEIESKNESKTKLNVSRYTMQRSLGSLRSILKHIPGGPHKRVIKRNIKQLPGRHLADIQR